MRFPFCRNRDFLKNGTLISIRQTGDGFHPGLFINREIKRRTKAIGAFPDGQSALMLVCARLRHVAGTQWGANRYMNMDHLYEMDIQEGSDIIAG